MGPLTGQPLIVDGRHGPTHGVVSILSVGALCIRPGHRGEGLKEKNMYVGKLKAETEKLKVEKFGHRNY